MGYAVLKNLERVLCTSSCRSRVDLISPRAIMYAVWKRTSDIFVSVLCSSLSQCTLLNFTVAWLCGWPMQVLAHAIVTF